MEIVFDPKIEVSKGETLSLFFKEDGSVLCKLLDENGEVKERPEISIKGVKE